MTQNLLNEPNVCRAGHRTGLPTSHPFMPGKLVFLPSLCQTSSNWIHNQVFSCLDQILIFAQCMIIEASLPKRSFKTTIFQKMTGKFLPTTDYIDQVSSTRGDKLMHMIRH